MRFLSTLRLSRTNLVQKPWDYHGTKNVFFSTTQHRYRPRKPGTLEIEAALRVVSNLSFTAKFDVNKTPGFERNQGFCSFWPLKRRVQEARKTMGRLLRSGP